MKNFIQTIMPIMLAYIATAKSCTSGSSHIPNAAHTAQHIPILTKQNTNPPTAANMTLPNKITDTTLKSALSNQESVSKITVNNNTNKKEELQENSNIATSHQANANLVKDKDELDQLSTSQLSCSSPTDYKSETERYGDDQSSIESKQKNKESKSLWRKLNPFKRKK